MTANISYSGDKLKRIVSITLICSLLCICALAADAPSKAGPMSFSAQGTIEASKAPEGGSAFSQGQTATESLTLLKSDSGKNFSAMNMTLYSAVNQFGWAGMSVGEIVKFTAPKAGWKLKKIQIVGLSAFNNTTKTLPPDKNFLVEVRDKNADLLYRFVDTQNMYFASAVGPVISGIDVPAIPVTDEFYIVFYDRGTMLLGMEPKDGTGNSYFVFNGRLTPAQFKNPKTNETIKVNWLIRALGD